eukprot:TRINITY_DN9931_c0_g1_i1.p1 TRINITY_DN9931_c0_g1~~TRINITY_DN9931_c0_g1_i1.p1  ORF type:complete len:517 (+),score=70.85 TRINITY_DN9931_c0_g1_i1:46-1596(+)
MKKWGRRAAVALGAGLGAYKIDEWCCYSVGLRSLRTAGTGLYLLYEYKVVWTPENSGEVHRRVAERIVECLRKNEGMYVKFGQQLTTMGHVLPPEYSEAFSTLYSDASVYPGEDMKAMVEHELGVPTSAIFSDFSLEPVASASIAQVHKATLHDGTTVAVKIQKPNIAYQVTIDFNMFYIVLYVIEKAFSIPTIWAHDYSVARYCSELDFEIERMNSKKSKAYLTERFGSQVYVPQVVEPPGVKNSKKVLITEWIPDTVTINNTKGLRELGIDSNYVMSLAVSLYAYSIFQTGHVHCDPHPGNLLVRKVNGKPQLVLLDHGLYVDLNDEIRTDYARFWSSMILADSKTLKEVCDKWGVTDSDFFASVTQMRPYKASKGASQMMSMNSGKLTSEQMAKIHMKIKEKLASILRDTAAFPRELLFVGRALNYLRSHNWCHGSIVNRVKILGMSAAKGLSLPDQIRFHVTLNFLRGVEILATTFPTLWGLILSVLPSSAAATLARFGAALQSSPEIPKEF